MRVYLGGPINGCTDEEANGWRQIVAPLLEAAGHTPVDPMVRDYRGKEDIAWREIVEMDKKDIDKCQVLLMYSPKPSVGTAMEILYGFQQRKNVIVVVPPDAPVSPWLRYHASELFIGSPTAAVWEFLLTKERVA
jgi:hypothetical protein